MKKVLIAAMLSMAFAGASVQAAEKELSPQQQKMKDCNADAKAKELKGDERKAFMKECLSSGKIEKTSTTEKAEKK